MRAWLGKLAVSGGALLLTLLAAEGGARFVEGRAAAYQVSYLTAYDPLLGWSKIPNGSVENVTREFHVVERINSKGLRGPEVPYRKPADSLRVLLLGDSFLEGYGVNEEDLLSSEVRRRLSENTDATVEVVNAGTVGYATDQELLFYELEGRKYNPDFTVLLFYVNDVWFNSKTRYWRGQKPRFRLRDGKLELTTSPVPEPDPDEFAFEVQGGRGLTRFVRRSDAWLGTRSSLYRLARSAAVNNAFVRGQLIESGLAEVPGEWMPWRKETTAELEDAWELTEALLVRLRDEVEADGSKFAVFYVPSRPAVYAEDWHKTRRAYAMDEGEWDPAQDSLSLAAICERRKIPCVIALNEFRAAAGESEAPRQSLYFQDNAHWTPRGHQLAGRLIADYVLAQIVSQRPPQAAPKSSIETKTGAESSPAGADRL